MTAVIDSHIHFWDLKSLSYPWLYDAQFDYMREDFGPAELTLISQGVDLVGTVHVQAEMDHEADPVAETAWLSEISTLDAHGRRVPEACVGYADLRLDGLSDVLDRHREFSLFRGVRQEAWYAPSHSRLDVVEDELLTDDRWCAGLKVVAEKDLSFDLLVFPQQLSRAAEVFSQLPSLRVVVEHLGLPASADDRAQWRSDLARFAQRVPWARIKISGLAWIAPKFGAVEVRDAVLDALDIFGPQRAMVGSDFPVDMHAGSYVEYWHTLFDWTSDLHDNDRALLFSGTAREFYRLA